ncbi:PPE family protein [Mycobacterium florentinum]|uniref:PPE family protein n=5 Tax=Mycobacterium florentinum TaxID=292462 RepID=UPI00138C49F5|nr:PPE family protein [Mycobacterium florentinum]BBX76890.1 PPE family protein PPE26 [Mycobacterium florentinum]
MSIDFGALPPEVNSARLYSGAGSTSLITAASAWNSLAAELNSAALGYESVISQLSSEEWLGPASAAAVQALTPYVTWVKTTASQAEQAAQQLSSASAAFEAAFASVVPPPVIAQNRALLAQAMQTNVLGQNTGVIAQLEAQYGQFWAQDASTMYNYAAQSSSATKVTPFQNAPEVTTADAQAKQGAATSAASATGAGNAAKTTADAIQQTPSTLQAAATPAAAAATTSTTDPFTEAWFLLTGQTILPSSFATFINGLSPFAGFAYNTEGLPYFSVGMGNSGVQIAKSTGAIGGAAASAAAAAPKGLAGLGGMLGGGAHAAPAVAAGLGNAASVGRLSVPAVWSGAAPAVSHAAAVPVSAISAAPEAAGSGNLLGGMPLAGMGGSHGVGASGPRYGFRPTVMARPPFAG